MTWPTARCFLVGIREIQDLERRPSAPSHPSTFKGDEDLLALFDPYTWAVHFMSDDLQRLCHQLPPGDSMPDAWKELEGTLTCTL